MTYKIVVFFKVFNSFFNTCGKVGEMLNGE